MYRYVMYLGVMEQAQAQKQGLFQWGCEELNKWMDQI